MLTSCIQEQNEAKKSFGSFKAALSLSLLCFFAATTRTSALIAGLLLNNVQREGGHEGENLRAWHSRSHLAQRNTKKIAGASRFEMRLKIWKCWVECFSRERFEEFDNGKLNFEN